MDESAVSVDICICTFRRAHLAQTLQSLALLILPAQTRISLIIADNDETPSARKTVEDIAQNYPHPVRYLHAPARNISLARNACLDAATADFVAFIDDDELATPNWLAALLARQRASKADVILGPVQSIYPAASPDWLRRGDFHSTKPVWVKGKIVTGYTSNVLFVRKAGSINGLRFKPDLGRSGGEDTAFFTDVHRAGGIIDYARDAIVTEEVAAERMNLSWLLKRFFRSGQTHGRLLLEGRGLMQRIPLLILAGAKCVFCGAMALAGLMTDGWRYWLLRGTLHAGVVAYGLGMQELKQYG